MPYFPQLSTGSSAQYPLLKSWSGRTVRTVSLDGGQVKWADAGAKTRGWELRYAGLTSAEADALRALFAQCEGKLTPFVFFDPAGNLLARSEEFNTAPWQAGPMLRWTGGVDDPLGTQRAMRVINAGAAVGSVAQGVDVPGNYQCCFSIYARGATATQAAFRRTTAGSSLSEPLLLGSAWKRYEFSGALSGASGPTTFALDIPAGAVVDLWGAQLEPQGQASSYRRTFAQSGVRANARFDQNELTMIAEGIDNYSMKLRIVSNEEA